MNKFNQYRQIAISCIVAIAMAGCAAVGVDGNKLASAPTTTEGTSCTAVTAQVFCAVTAEITEAP